MSPKALPQVSYLKGAWKSMGSGIGLSVSSGATSLSLLNANLASTAAKERRTTRTRKIDFIIIIKPSQ